MASSDGTEQPAEPGHLTTEALFRQHADFVVRFLTRLGVPASQLDDALQEVFLVVHRQGGYRPGIAKPTSYLASIAIRAASKHRQREGVARARHSDAGTEQLATDAQDPAQALAVRQDLERLQLALQRLPHELCTTLLLVEMEGESCVSVAAGLGCPVGTIYWRVHQARKELRAALRSIDAERGRARAADERGELQPARSWMVLLGLDAFKDSEASRLLRLARAQPTPHVALELWIAQHHALVRAGAELPAWASGLAPQSASWISVLGAGPIAAGVAVSAAIATLSVLALQPPQHAHAPRRVETIAHVAPAPVPARAPIAAPPSVPSAPQETAIVEPSSPAPRATDPRAALAPSADEETRALGEAAPDTSAVIDAILAETSEPARAARSAPPSSKAAAHAEQPAPEPAAQPAKPEHAEDDARIERELSDAELAEMRDIARAERLLEGDPARALALTRAMEAGFPRSRFREERAYVEVMALRGLGRTGEMRERADAFLRAYPSGLYSARVRKAVASRQK